MLCLRGNMTKFSWRRESSTSGSLKMDSCLMLTECLSRRILRFRTSAIDFIHSERMLTSTSSFFAHRLAYSSHASMIMPKFWCHEYETGSLYFGPLLKRSLSFILRHLSLYGHMERKEILNPSSCKVGDHVKDFESRVAANLLCN